MQTLFSLDNPIVSVICKLANLIYLTVLWLLCCIPVFTIGASTTAFYYTIQKNIKNDRGYVTASFFGSLKSNFGIATKIWFIFALITALLLFDVDFANVLILEGKLSEGTQVVIYLMMALLGNYAIWTFAYLARFENSCLVTLKNVLLITVFQLPQTIGTFLLAIGAVFVIWLMPPLIVLMPGVSLWLINSLCEKSFRKFMLDEDKRKEDELNRQEGYYV